MFALNDLRNNCLNKFFGFLFIRLVPYRSFLISNYYDIIPIIQLRNYWNAILIILMGNSLVRTNNRLQ